MNTNSEITLGIDGMSCGHCVSRVTRALAGIGGLRVGSVKVGEAALIAPDAAAVVTAIDALAEAGYAAKVVQQPQGGPTCHAGH